MNRSPNQNRDEVEIAISQEIYEGLRQYCDENNLRFKYFIEEILENAPRQDEMMKLSFEASGLLKKVKYLMNKMEDERQRSFERGFAQGVLVALLNSAGYSGISHETIPEKIRQTLQRKAPTDDRQMSLFD